MKLEVGMYVRTLFGNIYKIQDEEFEIKQSAFTGDILYKKNNEFETITKASHSLLGNDEEPCLIEVGDYVNGYKVTYVYPNLIKVDSADIWEIHINDIKSIVTKEQFESMSYRVNG